jgi:hypothetical protein
LKVKKEKGTETPEALAEALAYNAQIPKLREEVEQFSSQFPIPGFTLG